MTTQNLSYLKIEDMIYAIRSQRVMLDSDLAKLYGVETKFLKRAVKRNLKRFPEDFMFEMTSQELENWRYQFGTSNSIKMGLRIKPYVFTELGVAMLSSILNSEQAIEVNINIMRIFVKLRSILSEKGLHRRMDNLESNTNKIFNEVFEKLDQVDSKLNSYAEAVTPKLPNNRKKIGFRTNN